jgi:hypothetical protein
MPSLYETDYYQWAVDTAKALREGRLQDIDVEATAEEISDLGKSERRALESAIVQLYVHLLKQRYQPERQITGSSWQKSINKQRFHIAKMLRENPSLKRFLTDSEFIGEVYREAVLESVEQTDLSEETFPAECPFTYEDFGLPPKGSISSPDRQ